MIKFFRKIRQNLLSEGKTGKYLKYAIGEIFLVVIGILIALQINNWNDQRKLNKEVSKINERLFQDIDNDIRDLYSKKVYWENKVPVFNKVFNDSVTLDLFDEGYTRLVTSIDITSLNKTGIQQLKALNINDNLSVRIIELYNEMENSTIIPDEIDIDDRANDFVNYLKEKNYSWYPEWISKTIKKDNSSKELQDYFLTSIRYRNEVSLNRLHIVYRYLPSLKYYIAELEKVRTELKIKTDDDFITVNKKHLEKNAGTYKTIKIEGDPQGIKIEDRFKIEAFENFLRISSVSGGYTDGLYLKENNIFFTESEGFKIKLKFNKNQSGEIISAKLIWEYNDNKSVFHLALVN